MRSDEEKKLASVLTKLWLDQILREYPNWSLYKVERHIEPLYPSKPHEPLTQHRSKWNKYRKGLHRPGIRTIQKISLQHPDIKYVLSSRLEKVLFASGARWQTLSEQDRKLASFDMPKTQINYSASFQDLASLIRIWRYLFRTNKNIFKAQINSISSRIYRILLLLSLDFDLDENKENLTYLYQVLSSEIFSKCNNEFPIFSEKRFINQARILKKITDSHFNENTQEILSLHVLAYRYMTTKSRLCKYPKLLFTPYKSPVFYELNCIFREILKEGFCTKDNFMRIVWLSGHAINF